MEHIIESIPVTLKWQVENASSLFLCSNIDKDIDISSLAEIKVRPKRNAYYYLKASNDLFNITSDKINIEVQPLPALPRFENIIPSGKELIPVFNLNFKETTNEILNSSEVNFSNMLVKTERFSISKILKQIFKK